MVNPDKLFGRLGNRLFQMAYLYGQAKAGNIPDIYVQDPAYFENCKDELRAILGTDIEPINQVSIHVRRGGNPSNPSEPNYCDNPFYVNLTETQYYDKAMAEFPHETFLVFSDDIEWCKEHFKGDQFEFSEGNDDITDFNLMAGCKGHIIANSSFSWWAAYVSGKKTVAPKEWYADGVERTKLPKEWKRV